eukprot:TRINITY_DN4854_c0_g1_i1.p1 TRINITY_DN4854_c0_g1~~TRINITY_DN4854_c0_g1_i1.p1  ORF type:complete len:361 (+),score=84.60 TRINITY_DN4854_c0_g1_i1:80-1162(+)
MAHSLTRQRWELPPQLGQSFDLKEVLAAGAYALVYRVQARSDGESFAMKIVDKEPMAARGMMPQLRREITHVQDYRHSDHVVQIRNVFETSETVFLRFDLCERSLEDYAIEHGVIDETEAINFVREAALGLQSLHSHGLVHRDVKPGNLLLDFEGSVRICDFGWCCLESDGLRGRCGTPQFAPPEMLVEDGPLHTRKADVYSLAVCLQQFLLGKIPAGAEDLPTHASEDMLEFLSELLQHAPEARPTIDDVLESPQLEEPGPLDDLLKQGRSWLIKWGAIAEDTVKASSGVAPSHVSEAPTAVPSTTPSGVSSTGSGWSPPMQHMKPLLGPVPLLRGTAVHSPLLGGVPKLNYQPRPFLR